MKPCVTCFETFVQTKVYFIRKRPQDILQMNHQQLFGFANKDSSIGLLLWDLPISPMLIFLHQLWCNNRTHCSSTLHTPTPQATFTKSSDNELGGSSNRKTVLAQSLLSLVDREIKEGDRNHLWAKCFSCEFFIYFLSFMPSC